MASRSASTALKRAAASAPGSPVHAAKGRRAGTGSSGRSGDGSASRPSTAAAKPKDPPPLGGTIDLGGGAAVDYFPSALGRADAARLLAALRAEPRWAQREIQIIGRVVLQPRLVAYCADPGLQYTYSGRTLAPEPWTPAVLEVRRRVEQMLRQRRLLEGVDSGTGDGSGDGSIATVGRSAAGQQQQQQHEAAEAAAGPGSGSGSGGDCGGSDGEGAAQQAPSFFNSCLLNWYRSGDDHQSWHSDNEPLYGPTPTIGVVAAVAAAAVAGGAEGGSGPTLRTLPAHIAVSVSFGQARDFMVRSNCDPMDKWRFRLGAGDVLVMRGTMQQHWMHRCVRSGGRGGCCWLGCARHYPTDLAVASLTAALLLVQHSKTQGPAWGADQPDVSTRGAAGSSPVTADAHDNGVSCIGLFFGTLSSMKSSLD